MPTLDAIQARINKLTEDLAKVSAACALPITLHPTGADTTQPHAQPAPQAARQPIGITHSDGGGGRIPPRCP